jgi:hypothetical protein
MNKRYWTDYPFVSLGDTLHEVAPIREIAPIIYDGDKYVLVRLVGTCVYEELKSGYIYTERGRCGDVPCADPKVFLYDKSYTDKAEVARQIIRQRMCT